MNTWVRLGSFLGDPDVRGDVPLKYIPRSYKNGTHPVSRERGWGPWDPKNNFRTSEDLAEYRERFDKYLEIMSLMRQAGVQMMTGTDTLKPFNVPGFSLQQELEFRVKAGFTPMEALQAATRNPAQFLGMADSLGTVEEGKIADLVLLESNSLEDIRNTRKISAVVTAGRLILESSLRAMLEKVEAEAKTR